jgi:hypothetical protein
MAVIQVALALFLYLLLVLDQQLTPSLYAAGYAAFTTWPLLILFAAPADRRRYSVTLIYLAIGLSWPGFVALLASSLNVPRALAIAAMVIALVGLAIVRLREHIVKPHAFGATIGAPPTRGSIVALLALCVIGVAPTFVYATHMGHGNFPSMFFNADNPYHLSHVWSILRDPGYPVMSLCVFGERRTYQYGGQAAAAMLSAFSSLPAHTTYLGVIYPAYKVGMVAAAWRFAERLNPGVPLWLSAGTLAVFSRFPIDLRELSIGWSAMTGGLPDPLPMNLFDIDHVLTQFGMFSAVLVAAYVADERDKSLRVPALLSVAMLPIFKMSFFLGLGSALGAWLTVVAVRARSIRPILVGLATLIAALLFVHVLALSSEETSGNLVISPFSQLKDFLAPIAMKVNGAFGEATLALTLRGLRIMTMEYAVGLHWLIVSIVAIAIAGWRRTPRWPEWCAFALAPLVFMNVFKYVRGPIDNESIRSSIDVTFTLVPYLVLAASLALVARTLEQASNSRRRFVYAIFTAYIAFFVATNMSTVVALRAVPAVGYERADNASIVAALAAIPVDRALIVTNDTRYPATNFAAHDLQMQIPGIFGHHAYFVDAVNDRFEDSEARRAKQEMLRERIWQPQLLQVAKAEGWTHLLIRRDYPHAEPIPLRLVFENADYQVFAFQSGS